MRTPPSTTSTNAPTVSDAPFYMHLRTFCWVLAFLAWAATLVVSVRPGDFKACKDSSVCRRFRQVSEQVESFPSYVSPYAVAERVAKVDDAKIHLLVKTALHDVSFDMNATFFADGNARLQMDEHGPTYKDWRHYPEANVWGIAQMPALAEEIRVTHPNEAKTVVSWGAHESGNMHEMHIDHAPLRISFLRDGVVQMMLNERALLHMEHFRPKPEGGVPSTDEQRAAFIEERVRVLKARHPTASPALIDMWSKFETPDEGEWEESWGGVHDSKPKGPEGVALDISFPGYDTLMGLPEHASPLSLRSTRAPPHGEADDEPGRFSDPYRLMNTDVFEYEYDSPMALYGSAPVVHALSRSSAVSVLWMNAAETWVDIHKSKQRPGPAVDVVSLGASHADASALSGGTSAKSSHVHFMSESGILDLFVFMGPTLARNMERYMSLVGRTALPQYFAIGYHQCRWNYWSDDDVKDVSRRFDDADIPMDVIWLDIEYSLDHMYGVWDKKAFIDPAGMMRALDARGRKLVIIIDPHLKKTDQYFLYKEAKSQDLLVKTADGRTNYEGECWSGQASWIDFFQPRTWQWWIDQFRLTKQRLEGNARNLFVWNDMSEPAIFSGPEVSSPKDVRHFPGWENRDIHNINGVILHNLTATGLTRRELGTRDAAGQAGVERRPFVLSRAWWLGTQRFGAVWTGDNMGTWEHFANSVPMILQNGMGGMSFCGADIGGFFGNPDSELLVRWYQAGIFEPFFRAHAHIDTKRREPYLFDGEVGDALRMLLQLRYKLLPVWYTAFWDSSVNGQPVLKPQALMFPDDPRGFAIDDQYYLGESGLLVKPPAKQGISHVDMYLADDQDYFHYHTKAVYRGRGVVHVPAPLNVQMPLLQRGGSILPVRERLRRAAELQRLDPFSLHVAIGRDGSAHGHLYMDDGQTYAYRDQQAFIARAFTWAPESPTRVHMSSRALTSRDVSVSASLPTSNDGSVLQRAGNPYEKDVQSVRVERITVVGFLPSASPVRVWTHDAHGREVELRFDLTPSVGREVSHTDSSTHRAAELVIHDPRVPIGSDWDVWVDFSPPAPLR